MKKLDNNNQTTWHGIEYRIYGVEMKLLVFNYISLFVVENSKLSPVWCHRHQKWLQYVAHNASKPGQMKSIKFFSAYFVSLKVHHRNILSLLYLLLFYTTLLAKFNQKNMI